MDCREYQEKAHRTINEDLSFREQLSNMCMGLAGESGEVIDCFKKYMYQGHNLNYCKILEELGDALWYLTNLASLLNISLEEIMEENIKKLEKRYPNGFNSNNSINRGE